VQEGGRRKESKNGVLVLSSENDPNKLRMVRRLSRRKKNKKRKVRESEKGPNRLKLVRRLSRRVWCGWLKPTGQV
jgi:hypothetical protein